MKLNDLEKEKLSEDKAGRGYTISYIYHGLRRRHTITTLQPLTLGRQADCDICLPHPGIAPIQCRFERTSQGELLVFSESDNTQTCVNGFPVEFQALKPGDSIRVGSIVLKVGVKRIMDSVKPEGIPLIRQESEFEELFMDALKRSPWLAVSLFLHLALILLLFNIEQKSGLKDATVGFIQGHLDDPSDEVKLDHSSDLDNSGLDEMTPPEPIREEPELEEKTDSPANSPFENPADNPDSEYALGMSGPSHLGRDLSRIRIRRGGGTGGGGGTEWNMRVGTLRDSGLDIAILFDSTGSMEGFIREVKATIKGMVHVLQDIVPNVAVGLITYKGDPLSSTYVVAGTPLVRDPYELLNFMDTVDISGGSAEGYAAIMTALKTACDGLTWREGSEKVIVIIGDAPPFPEEVREGLEMIRRFEGKVALIYKPSSGVTRRMEPQTTDIFQKMATAGQGPFLRHEGGEDVVRLIVTAILGTRWRNEVTAAFDEERTDRWIRLLRRKERSGDFEWFIRQFKRPKVKPELVDALIEMGSEDVAREMWRCLQSENHGSWLLQRTLFVLQSMTDMHIGYINSKEDRFDRARMTYIAEALKHFYGPDVLGDEDRPQSR